MSADPEEAWQLIPALTRSEANVLQALMQKEGQFVETRLLNRAASGRVFVCHQNASVHICRIRKRLPTAYEIENRKDRGYRLVRKEPSNG